MPILPGPAGYGQRPGLGSSDSIACQSSRIGEKTSTISAPSAPTTTECGTCARIRHVAPGPSSRVSSPIVKRDGSLEEEAYLLVHVRVLGDDGVRFELEQAEGNPLAVDRAPDDSLPDLLWPERADVGEDAHRIFTLPIERRPRNQAEWRPCPASPFWPPLPWS